MSIACKFGRHEWNQWHSRQVRQGVRAPYDQDLVRRDLVWVHIRECLRPGCDATEMQPFKKSKVGDK